MKRLALVLIAACGSDNAAPSTAVASPAAVPHAQLVGCRAALPPPVDPRPLVTGDRYAWAAKPRLHQDFPKVSGSLVPGAIQAAMFRQARALYSCYEHQLMTKPDLEGVVEATFAIRSSGAVVGLHVEGVDPELSKCFAGVIRGVAFPKPPDGNLVQITLPFKLSAPGSALARYAERRAPKEWTPYATTPTVLPEAVAALMVEAVTTAMRARLPAIERCFDGARGIVRAMFSFRASGEVDVVRAGGLGDLAVERCIAAAAGGFTAPGHPGPADVACDFAAGVVAANDAPLRVSPDAGYTVMEVTATEMRNRSSVREIPPRGAGQPITSIGTDASVLVIAEPDAPAHGLEYALWWAPAGTTLVAVKASGGAPVLVGMGDSRAKREPNTDTRVVELRTEHGQLRACLARKPFAESPAALVDARAMDRLLGAVAAACKETPCEPTIVVGTSGDFIAKDLVATTSAARRAGFQSISIGGPACE